MIDVKQAVTAAMKYFNEVDVGRREALLLRVEEVEQSGNFWYITLGFDEGPIPFVGNRRYKTFQVDVNSGEVVSMKMRQV